jgi:hypothetical protein
MDLRNIHILVISYLKYIAVISPRFVILAAFNYCDVNKENEMGGKYGDTERTGLHEGLCLRCLAETAIRKTQVYTEE